MWAEDDPVLNEDETFENFKLELAEIQALIDQEHIDSTNTNGLESGVAVNTSARINRKDVSLYARNTIASEIRAVLQKNKEVLISESTDKWTQITLITADSGELRGWVRNEHLDIRKDGIASKLKRAAWLEALELAYKLNKKYQDNEHIEVVSLNIELSVPPGISLSFKFKESPSSQNQ